MGETGGFGDQLVFFIQGGLLARHLDVESGGFGEPIAADTPMGGGDFLDEPEFDRADGMELA